MVGWEGPASFKQREKAEASQPPIRLNAYPPMSHGLAASKEVVPVGDHALALPVLGSSVVLGLLQYALAVVLAKAVGLGGLGAGRPGAEDVMAGGDLASKGQGKAEEARCQCGWKVTLSIWLGPFIAPSYPRTTPRSRRQVYHHSDAPLVHLTAPSPRLSRSSVSPLPRRHVRPLGGFASPLPFDLDPHSKRGPAQAGQKDFRHRCRRVSKSLRATLLGVT
ncbi:hypothetical protein BDZ90DRAFT_41143 [Jaminaea rosea]|uniref:Uncharacterized protein n=1 Tax=Jaminaea rosea TaxID=1569628 RepID=A0A316URQ3_9BASI|nr:hypothetical protein BDZ90DRAFT_41143 [Jaminaea rosea]PWN26553.1 hypothetical protein BDZ90DRAFT_41143 [Jaminaea rosea]